MHSDISPSITSIFIMPNCVPSVEILSKENNFVSVISIVEIVYYGNSITIWSVVGIAVDGLRITSIKFQEFSLLTWLLTFT